MTHIVHILQLKLLDKINSKNKNNILSSSKHQLVIKVQKAQCSKLKNHYHD